MKGTKVCFRFLCIAGGVLGILIASKPLNSKLIKNVEHLLSQEEVLIIWNSKNPLRGEIMLELQEELSIGSENDEDEAFYNNINFLIDNAGNYFIADVGNDRVQKFDPSGKYIQTIGHSGQGPGDLNKPYHISLSEEGKLFIYQQPSRLSIFNPDGEFLRSITFRPSATLVIPLGNSCFMGTTYELTPKSTLDRVILFGPNGEKLRTIDEFENKLYLSFIGDKVVGTYQTYRPHLWCFRIGNELAGYAFSGEYRIHIVSAAGDVVRIIEKADQPERITEAEKDGVIENEIWLRRKQGVSLPKSEVRKAYVFPDHKPYFLKVFSDDKGRLYVLKFGDYKRHKILNFDMFDAHGKYVYNIKISIAGRIIPLFIKEDFLYAVAVDSEGYSQAKKFRILNWSQLEF